MKCVGRGGLIANLKETAKQIYEAIDRNTKEFLYGTQQKDNLTLQAPRFLPDSNNNSETNEIILQGGGRWGHFAVFRLIKVPMLANGQKAKFNEKPSYFDYFKIESNLGAGCNQPDRLNNTCLGTYLTKIQPYFRNSRQEFELFSQNPSTDPQFYQIAIEETLRALINVERQLLFYREPSDLNEPRCSQPFSEEAKEWIHLNQLRKLLSGKAHAERVEYAVPDLLNPALNHSRIVENQMDYMQNGGSCPIFSIKSLVKSILGPELTSLHNHFMQTHNVMDCKKALNKLINRNNQIIKKLKPLSINGYHEEIMIWIKEFKKFLNNESIYFEVKHEKKSNQSTIILREVYLKNQWSLFMKARQGTKENKMNQNDFFRRQNLQQPCVINVDSQSLPRI